MADTDTPQGYPVSPTLVPAGVYVRRDEMIRLTSYNALTSVILGLRSRVMDLEGCIADGGSETHTPNTDRSAKKTYGRIDEGWLLDGQVLVTSAAPLIGQTYVVVELVRGEPGAEVPTRVLASGYVTAKQPLMFPAVAFQQSLDGGGALRSITGSTPGAGNEISETVPAGARWDLLAFRAVFTTSATVANRIPQLVLDDGANEFYRGVGSQNLTAGVAWLPNFGPGISRVAAEVGNEAYGSLPVGIRLGAGYRMRTVTTAIQAGDAYTAVQYLVRETLEGA